MPRELKGTALPFNYNKLAELEEIVSLHGNDIAAIIMEPQRGTAPDPGFLQGVRDIATKIGAVLIFDEVTSGFRINLGGIHLTMGVKPDIAVFGKAMGNGFPISAIIGIRAVMDCAQNSFISSTFWTERIGFVAALAAIEKMKTHKVQEKLVHYGQVINDGWTKVAQKHGIPIAISGITPLTHLTFKTQDPEVMQTLYTQEMLAKGYLLGASVYSTYSYTEAIIERFVEDSDTVFGTLESALNSNNAKMFLKHETKHSGFKRLT